MEKYDKIQKIGNGNFGSITLVQRKTDLKRFALKKIDLPCQDALPEKCLEVSLLKSLTHTHIISFEEAFEIDGKLAIVMEYASNGDLLKKVNETRKAGEIIEEEQIIQWMKQISLAMKYLLDMKVIHRDIKIQNILLDEYNNIKLGDFGISKKLDATNELSNTSVGTPYYMSPEICTSSQYSHASDMWMLGCALYELCTLTKPFKGDSINSVIISILQKTPEPIENKYSDFLKAIIFDLLMKDPTKRPTIQQLLERIEAYEAMKKENKINKEILADFDYNSPNKSASVTSKAKSYSTDDSNTSSPFNEIKSPTSRAGNSIYSFLERARLTRGAPVLENKEFKRNTKRTFTDIQISKQQSTKESIESIDIDSKDLPFLDIKQRSSMKSISTNPSKFHKNQLFRLKTCLDDDEEILKDYPKLPRHSKSSNTNILSPKSPQRKELVCEFLKTKLGDIKYQTIEEILLGQENPREYLKTAKSNLLQLLGQENKDYIPMLGYMIPVRESDAISS